MLGRLDSERSKHIGTCYRVSWVSARCYDFYKGPRECKRRNRKSDR
jgi:hypothetical protein